MTSIPPSGGVSVTLNFTTPEADKKPLTAMSLARRNSIAFKEFILSKAFEELGYEGQSTFRKASSLSQLLNKIDDLKKGYAGGEGLVEGASQSDGGPKVAILNIFHPDYDANNLTPENRDILRAASYFEGVNFNNLTGADFNRFDQVSKALGTTVNDYGLLSNDSTTNEAEATIQKILDDLKGQGIVV
jgi:hypothetical protein